MGPWVGRVVGTGPDRTSGTALTEEGQHGQDPSVAVRLSVTPPRPKTRLMWVSTVLRPRSDFVGQRAVRLALGHLGQHVALSWRQGRERVRAPGPGQHPAHDGRVDDALARGEPVQGVHQGGAGHDLAP